MLTCTFDAPDGGAAEVVLLPAPRRVPFTVVAVLTRVAGSTRVRDCEMLTDVPSGTVVRAALLCARVRGAAEVEAFELDAAALARELAVDDAFSGRAGPGADLPWSRNTTVSGCGGAGQERAYREQA